ncbi:hypothetical protein [Thermoanaerobacterium thermosaccharolyticum]|uniref:hypothetical protein n=1 Tax=Thermoanaerobacterium thermosaccharolyticum TaxID=1517 RepID=UPI003DA8BE81
MIEKYISEESGDILHTVLGIAAGVIVVLILIAGFNKIGSTVGGHIGNSANSAGSQLQNVIQNK